MADTLVNVHNNKRSNENDVVEGRDAKKLMLWSGAVDAESDPAASFANARHEFGEHGGVNMSIEASATFTVMEPDTLRRMFAGELGPENDYFVYSRHFNPTVLNLSRQMAALEGTEAAYCTSSGMSAITAALLQLCSSGGHIVASSTLYGGTHALMSNFFPSKCNITTTFVEINDLDAVENAIVEGKTTVLYFESMANPSLKVANIPALARIGHKKGLTVVVDNTFSPMVLSPARLGADVVIHSVSKFISGGADIIAGFSLCLSFLSNNHYRQTKCFAIISKRFLIISFFVQNKIFYIKVHYFNLSLDFTI